MHKDTVAPFVRFMLIAALWVVGCTLVGYLLHLAALQYFLPAVISFAAAEEAARAAALCSARSRDTLGFWGVATAIGLAFGLLEISNAFFPGQYASVEAQTAPFALLAAFEFVFGFLLHTGLSAVMLALWRRFNWVAGFGAALTIHALWNMLLGA